MENDEDGNPLEEQRPETKFNSTNLYRWFKKSGGEDKSPKEKPYLTEDQKRERKQWCEDVKKLMAERGNNFYACFLDEKWFYITSRRRRIKVLPAGQGEVAADVAPVIPTAISRRHAMKVGISCVYMKYLQSIFHHWYSY